MPLLTHYQRLYLLARDQESDAPQQHIRMFELIVILCHEVGHLFTMHLNFECHVPHYRNDSPPEVVPGEPPGAKPHEAGVQLERRLWGGPQIRGVDGSGRELRFMVG